MAGKGGLDYRPDTVRSCPGAAFRLRQPEVVIHDSIGFFVENQGFCRVWAGFDAWA
jgi:hypothetical protein